MGSSVFCQTFARHNGLPVRPREIAYRATHVLTVLYPILLHSDDINDVHTKLLWKYLVLLK